jgi:hypothetical protein
MIKANAGKMRGVRVMRDPEGVLLDPFTDETGIQYGYVLVYGEEEPAVFDGTTWHPVMDSEENWEETLPEKLQVQAMKIMELAPTNPIYAELARIMNITVGVGAPSASSDSPIVIDYGKSAN